MARIEGPLREAVGLSHRGLVAETGGEKRGQDVSQKEKAPETVTWWVYLIRCGDGSLYTGIATDVDRRFEEHKSQGPKGAKYTRGKLPLLLVYRREVGTRSEASKEEYRIKALSRRQKLRLIAEGAESD